MRCLLLISCLAIAQVAGAEASELGGQVRRLVRQLDHDELSKREAAERALVELGPEVLEHLLPANARTPAEVKARLERIVSVLEHTAAEAAVAATHVTLNGNLLMSEVFAEINQQTGNKIVDFRENFGQEATDEQVAVDFDETPFWQALDTVLDQLNMVPYAYGGQPGAVTVVAAEPGQLPSASRVSYGGLFRLEATQVEATRDLRNPANEGLRLNLEIMWEPRLTPISLQQPLDQLIALDEDGTAVEIDGRQGAPESAVQSRVSAVELNLPLKLPARGVQRIAELRGTLFALVPGRVAAYEFDRLPEAKNVEQRKAGVTVVVEQLRKNGPIFEVAMLVRFDDAANALESHRGWIYANPALMLDPEGNEIPNVGFETYRQTPNEIGLRYKFDLPEVSDDHRFVYRTPAALVKIPVAYVIKDIGLP